MDDFTFAKRDTSWLSFNHRVLQEAMDKRTPLYEKIKFLAIYSSNLDEFYRVRVAALRQFKLLNKEDRKEFLDIKPKKELKDIKQIVHQQQIEFGTIFRNQILPGLRKRGIFLVNSTKLYSSSQRQFAQRYFDEQVTDNVSRQYLDPQGEAPFLKNQHLYLVVELKDSDVLGIASIPSKKLGRYVRLPSEDGKHYIGFLDDIVRINLGKLFPEKTGKAFAIKASRDAELYINDEYSGDLIEKIRNSLDKRDTGTPTRLLYDSEMRIEVTNRLKDIFQLKKNDLFPGARYHNFHDFFGFPDPVQDATLHDDPLPALPHPQLEKAESLLQLIDQKDQLLSFPYQRYDYVPRLIWEAAEREEIASIKITLYRVAAKSDVVNALLHAIERGKEVTAFIEAKARFDEASNLYWGKELEKAGARIIWSYPGIKVHTKLLLINRQPDSQGRVHRYAYLGTGNFNEKTAKLYCDHALLTADHRLTVDVDQIFGVLEKKIILPKCKHMLVSPFTTRQGLLGLVDQEVANAKAGKWAYIILKMNSLEDKEMIRKLYEASQAGVRCQLIVRGICCLVPGVPGQSEHIQVISIVDRFLEHARIFIFANGGQERMYTASADWMTRNLDRRIEAVMPIYDADAYQQLRDVIDLQLADNTKARIIDAGQTNPYRQQGPEELPVQAQLATYAYFRKKLTATSVPASGRERPEAS